MPEFTLIKMPLEAELAWAERAARLQIIDSYITARTESEATAARWEAVRYDRANPGTSSLVAELDAHDHQPAAA
ncbi:hypothetical protein [Streptomyces sp. WAC01280]|uniref:hypothetical protein n=1 Tax=Streptomyces sp. WAC01280 TaxID=2487424 RepID=UPI000F7AA643|nr:hypothetical protein [Streptomyces sp. WAC01280]RSS59810.1 hypothetical protein EF909_08085 [Streptomyces sp. WAC01280]